MTITWTTFAIRLLVGFFLAVGIGIERQWLKTRAVLKTNVLVTLGSAMFVMLSIMTPGDASPTRVSSQIVSGVGFLGGGVILRQGASIKGINTAATLWCAAAIGTLVGSGFLVQAYVSTLAVVGANLLLRPLVEAFKQQDKQENILAHDSDVIKHSHEQKLESLGENFGLQYSFYLLCSPEAEAKVWESIMTFAKERKLVVTRIESKNIISDAPSNEIEVEIKMNFANQDASNQQVDFEAMILALKTKAQVKAINWKLLSA